MLTLGLIAPNGPVRPAPPGPVCRTRQQVTSVRAMSDPIEPTLRRSPLHDRHVALGAKMADFGGWEMPIEYPGGGVVKEHTAVREAVGVFDVSHLGKAVVRGPGAAAYVNATLTNDLDRVGPGKAQYTLCCDDATGGVVDDLIAYYRVDDEVFLIPNAANTAEVVRRLAAAAPDGVEVVDLHEDYGVLAVQGPRQRRGARRARPAHRPRVHVVRRRRVATDVRWSSAGPATPASAATSCCRGGTTPPTLWDALLAAGEAYGIRPAGLGARDTLRTEMGYPLHGQDLSLEITPVQARCGWAVGWKKPAFWGRDALARREGGRGARGSRWGLEGLERGIPRPHMAVVHGGRRTGRRGHQRDVLADPQGGHRAGPARPVGRPRATRWSSTCAAGRPGSASSSRRSSRRRPRDPPAMRDQRVLLIGMMGSGKTSVGRAIEARTGWPYRDNDEAVAVLTGLPTQQLHEQRGTAALRAAESRVMHDALVEAAAVRGGVAGGVVESDDDVAALQAADAFVVYLHTPVEVLVRRVGDGAGRPFLQPDPACRAAPAVGRPRAAVPRGGGPGRRHLPRRRGGARRPGDPRPHRVP